jgi:hypothetical protein
MMRGHYYLHLHVTHPHHYGWVDIPRAVHLYCEGTPTPTGLILDYNKGVGWIYLDDVTDDKSP